MTSDSEGRRSVLLPSANKVLHTQSSLSIIVRRTRVPRRSGSWSRRWAWLIASGFYGFMQTLPSGNPSPLRRSRSHTADGDRSTGREQLIPSAAADGKWRKRSFSSARTPIATQYFSIPRPGRDWAPRSILADRVNRQEVRRCITRDGRCATKARQAGFRTGVTDRRPHPGRNWTSPASRPSVALSCAPR